MQYVHVFDLGKVLVDYDENLFVRKLKAACSSNAPVEEILNHHLDEIRVEIGGDFDRLHPLLVRDLNITWTAEELRLAWNDIFTPMPEMIALADQTPRPRYLLSTTNEPHASWLRQHYPYVFELFEHCFLSHEVGLAKPDIALFRHVESVTNQPPECHFFIDDLPKNVAAAHSAGWKAFQFVGIEDCRRRLAEAANGSGML